MGPLLGGFLSPGAGVSTALALYTSTLLYCAACVPEGAPRKRARQELRRQLSRSRSCSALPPPRRAALQPLLSGAAQAPQQQPAASSPPTAAPMLTRSHSLGPQVPSRPSVTRGRTGGGDGDAGPGGLGSVVEAVAERGHGLCEALGTTAACLQAEAVAVAGYVPPQLQPDAPFDSSPPASEPRRHSWDAHVKAPASARRQRQGSPRVSWHPDMRGRGEAAVPLLGGGSDVLHGLDPRLAEELGKAESGLLGGWAGGRGAG